MSELVENEKTARDALGHTLTVGDWVAGVCIEPSVHTFTGRVEALGTVTATVRVAWVSEPDAKLRDPYKLRQRAQVGERRRVYLARTFRQAGVSAGVEASAGEGAGVNEDGLTENEHDVLGRQVTQLRYAAALDRHLPGWGERGEKEREEVRQEAWALADVVLGVRDRELGMLRQRLALAAAVDRGELDLPGKAECDGVEREPSTCRCGCEGCQHHCAAHAGTVDAEEPPDVINEPLQRAARRARELIRRRDETAERDGALGWAADRERARHVATLARLLGAPEDETWGALLTRVAKLKVTVEGVEREARVRAEAWQLGEWARVAGVNPDRLEALADWLDVVDQGRGVTDDGVQRDLRAWASQVRTANADELSRLGQEMQGEREMPGFFGMMISGESDLSARAGEETQG